MVLEKRKKFHAYSGTNGSLFRLRLSMLSRFNSMLSSFFCIMTYLK
jgi:hypothetical protein